MSTRKLGSIALFLGLLASAPPVHAGINLVQLSPTNIDLNVGGEARKIALDGDVLIRSDDWGALIMTTPTKADSSRAGRCVVLASDGNILAIPIGSMQPGPVVSWTRPEAGQNSDLAVVRFHRDLPEWSADLTYRIRLGAPWIEVGTKISNQQAERELEIAVVDHLLPMDGGELASNDQQTLTLVNERGLMLGLMPVTGSSIAREGRVGWHLGIESGDPMPGVFRRASMRVLSFGRSSLPLMPIEASRDWHRNLRERSLNFRIPPQQNRTATRRLVVATNRDQLVQLMTGARETKPEPADAPPSPTPPVTVVSAPSEESAPPPVAPPPVQPKSAAPKTGKIVGKIRASEVPAPPAPTKLSGKLRTTEAESPAKPARIAPAPAPILPSKVSADQQKTEVADQDFAPIIDAIEDLPPPEE